MQKYGVLVNFPKIGISNMLLTEEHGKSIYETTNIQDAEDRARDQLQMVRKIFGSGASIGMSGVVPLTGNKSCGPMIKKYRFSDDGRVVEG